MTKRSDHQYAVNEFLRKCEEADPEKFKEICKKYPVLSMQRWRVIQEREKNGGLFSLEEFRDEDY